MDEMALVMGLKCSPEDVLIIVHSILYVLTNKIKDQSTAINVMLPLCILTYAIDMKSAVHFKLFQYTDDLASL